METEQKKSINKSDCSDNKKYGKKSNIIISILKFIGKGLLAILLILFIIFQLPWKIITALTIILAACTILPGKFRKRFWLTVGIVALLLVIWILIPENNTNWHPYTFEKEVADLEAQYKIPDEENAAFQYYEIFEKLNLDANQPDYFTTSEPCSLDELWLAKKHPEMAEWIADYQEIIESVVSTSKLKKCIMPPDFYKDRFDLTNDLAKIRFCVFLLISSANNDITEGRNDEAMEKYSTCFRIANQLNQLPSFTHVMVNWAIKEKAMLPLNNAIVKEKISSEYFQRIHNLIDDMQINWSSVWINMLDIDTIIAKNYFAGKTFEINKKVRLRFSRRPFWENTESLQEQVEYTYLSGITGKLRSMLRWICFPPSIKAITDIINKCVEDHYNMAQPDYNWNKDEIPETFIRLNYKFVMKLMMQDNTYNYNRIYNTIYLKEVTLLRGSKILIALRQYKDKHGKWPDSLDEIKSDVPPEAFIDPATEKQLQYENKGEDFILSGELINIWPFEIKYEISVIGN